MLAVAFTSLGALSIVIDRSLFHTFLYTGDNIPEFLVWRATKDNRTRLMLIEGMSLLKGILRYDTLSDIKILLSEHADRLLEDKISPCDAVFAGTWQIQKLTCKQINKMVCDDATAIPANLLPKPLEMGSFDNSRLSKFNNAFITAYGSKTPEARNWRKLCLIHKPSEIKRSICEHIVCVNSIVWALPVDFDKYLSKRKERLFKAYIYIYKYGLSVERAADLTKTSKEDLFYILKYVPIVLGRVFTKELPSPPATN